MPTPPFTEELGPAGSASSLLCTSGRPETLAHGPESPQGGDDLWDGSVVALTHFPIVGMVLECAQAPGREDQPSSSDGASPHPFLHTSPTCLDGPGQRTSGMERGWSQSPACILKSFFCVLVDSLCCCFSTLGKAREGSVRGHQAPRGGHSDDSWCHGPSFPRENQICVSCTGRAFLLPKVPIGFRTIHASLHAEWGG